MVLTLFLSPSYVISVGVQNMHGIDIGSCMVKANILIFMGSNMGSNLN